MQSEAVSTACPLDTSSNHKKQYLQTIADFFEDIVQTKFERLYPRKNNLLIIKKSEKQA